MLFELVRLSYVNNEPYALQKAYIPQDLFWDADRYEFGEGLCMNIWTPKERCRRG